MLAFTKDKEIPFAEIIDFFRPSDFPPRHRAGGHRGVAEESFWVSVSPAAAAQVRGPCRVAPGRWRRV